MLEFGEERCRIEVVRLQGAVSQVVRQHEHNVGFLLGEGWEWKERGFGKGFLGCVEGRGGGGRACFEVHFATCERIQKMSVSE